jgi:hypothetical protein
MLFAVNWLSFCNSFCQNYLSNKLLCQLNQWFHGVYEKEYTIVYNDKKQKLFSWLFSFV